MGFSGTATAEVPNIEHSQQNDRQKVLESAVSTVTALKRLLADYDRLQAERNDFQREHTRVVAENGALRKQTKEGTFTLIVEHGTDLRGPHQHAVERFRDDPAK